MSWPTQFIHNLFSQSVIITTKKAICGERENENMSAQRMKKPENCPSCNCQFICSLSGESQDIKCLSWFQWAKIQF